MPLLARICFSLEFRGQIGRKWDGTTIYSELTGNEELWGVFSPSIFRTPWGTGSKRKKPGSKMLSMLTQFISDRDEFQPSSDSQMEAVSSQLLVFVEGILLVLNSVWFLRTGSHFTSKSCHNFNTDLNETRLHSCSPTSLTLLKNLTNRSN